MWLWIYAAAGVGIVLVFLETNPSTRGIGLRIWAWWRRQGWNSGGGR